MVFRKLAQTMVVLLAAICLGTCSLAAENAGIGPEDLKSPGQVSSPNYRVGRESKKVVPPSGGAAQAESAARAESPAVSGEATASAEVAA